MQTQLAPPFKNTPDGEAAEAILRKCVHCGFCNATCPTYQLLGDELDGPRGRIYLIKQVLEGAPASRSTQLHLDRCLTCRNCEPTCPSGVEYGQLLDIGRNVVEQQVPRPRDERLLRQALMRGMTSALFSPALKLGRLVKPWLPASLKHKVPSRTPPAGRWPTRQHDRKVLLLEGCVQPALMPNINTATARVLDAAGLQTLREPKAGCCGALRTHLADRDGGLADMRRNVDAWWPYVAQRKVEAIVMNASGCGVTVREYGRYLAHDPQYADRARRISQLTRDVSELLPELAPLLLPKLRGKPPGKLAYHPPCTLQHGQQVRGTVEQGLRELGFDVALAPQDAHLCCGSAGAYSVLQPELANVLRDRKLEALAPLAPQAIVSGNVGCIQHLQTGTAIPVRHWVEVVDWALGTSP